MNAKTAYNLLETLMDGVNPITGELLCASGSTADEIAARMNRPVESIRARMFYMGLTREAPISLHPAGDSGKAEQEGV